MKELTLSDMSLISGVQDVLSSIVQECITMAMRIDASIYLLSNGWFVATRGHSEVYYERFNELYSDLSSGMLNDYLMSVV